MEERSSKTPSKEKDSGQGNTEDGERHQPSADSNASKKPKRVRTGCLTCRERHLKCDEGLPICQNCRKSNRNCKRGVKLNFIDTQCQAPPTVPRSQEWNVGFLDESRDIASEYKGGLSKYGVLETEDAPPIDQDLAFEFPSHSAPPAPILSHQSLPPIQGMLPEAYPEESQYTYEPPREVHHQHEHSHTDSTYSGSNIPGPQSTFSNHDRNQTPAEGTRDYLTSQEEVFFMQVFVEEVGLWMDSMDPMKHVIILTILPISMELTETVFALATLPCFGRTYAPERLSRMWSSTSLAGERQVFRRQGHALLRHRDAASAQLLAESQ